MFRICLGCDCVRTREMLIDVTEAYRDCLREISWLMATMTEEPNIQGVTDADVYRVQKIIERYQDSVPFP